MFGVTRHAKDPQRMYNYWSTAETELIALAPKAPFIMEEGQVEGHERQWKNAHTKPYPYMLYKGVALGGKPAPPPSRQPFAGSPSGVVQAKAGATDDMKATTGIRFDATMSERVSDESGKALRELKRTSDIGSFHYIDNLARSLHYTGIILIDLIPKIYDRRRVVTILREDGTEEQVKIDPSMQQAMKDVPKGDPQQQGGMSSGISKIFNPKVGDYSIPVTIGPSYATKRIESADSMMAFARSMPCFSSALPVAISAGLKNSL